ncbi:hypothetical protein [Rhizobium sp. Root708]|uniref:hypothetical protein n=1 Tax=Rhizobium sp. Root708 TaxID=1736592 RepID=UPI0012E3847C|nr:hypothetical protein [Rhizobium sp. Root708]
MRLRSGVPSADRTLRIADNIKALKVDFSEAELDRAFSPGAIVGNRYPDFVMKWAAQ